MALSISAIFLSKSSINLCLGMVGSGTSFLSIVEREKTFIIKPIQNSINSPPEVKTRPRGWQK